MTGKKTKKQLLSSFPSKQCVRINQAHKNLALWSLPGNNQDKMMPCHPLYLTNCQFGEGERNSKQYHLRTT